MSHFSVLVIGEDVEKQLAPYQENNMGDCPKEFMEFESYRDEWEDEDEETKKKYETYEKYAKEYHGAQYDEDKKDFGRWENPNRKWDWYVEGGRWRNMITRFDGTECDSAFIKDIDFEKMGKEIKELAEKAWEEGKDKDPTLKYFVYGIRKDDTKESYLSRRKAFSTLAVVKDSKWYEKGEMGWWGVVSNEKDTEQWEEEFQKLLSDLSPETRITVIDCHI